MNTDNFYELDTQEIAETLLSHVFISAEHWSADEKEVCAELEQAIYWIKCAAENKYNFDYFRILWKVLNELAAMKGVLLPY